MNKKLITIFSLVLLFIFTASFATASPMATYITWLDNNNKIINDDIMTISDTQSATFYWNSYAYEDSIFTTVEMFDADGNLINTYYQNNHTSSVGGYNSTVANTLANGNYLLVINAEDNFDNKDSDRIWLIVDNTVTPDNTAPVWTNTLDDITRDISTSVYELSNLNDDVYDAEGDNLTFTVSSSDESISTCTFDKDNLFCDLNSVGDTKIDVNVSDGEFTATESFVLTVTSTTPDNTAPVWTTNFSSVSVPLTDLTYNLDDLNNHVYDAEGDNLTFTAYSSDEEIANCTMDEDNLVCQLNSVGSTLISISVTDGEFFTTTDFGLTVYDSANLIQMNCNEEVVLGHKLQCTANVVNGLNQPIENAEVRFNLEDDNDGYSRVCYTNDKGYCNILELIQKGYTEGESYDVSAQAFADGLGDSEISYDTFNVWEEGYYINDLHLYNDSQFSLEDDDFLRGEAMYTKFMITDLDSNLITDESLIKHVYLVVNNDETLDFEEWEDNVVEELTEDKEAVSWFKGLFTKADDYFYYYLPKIPLTDNVLGNGNVFYFVFDIENEIAGQELVAVRINNNPIIFEGIEEIVLNKDLEGNVNTHTISLNEYVYDLETPDNEIVFTFESEHMDIIDLGNNQYEIIPTTNELGTYNLIVRANDTDGSIEEQTVTIRIVSEEDNYYAQAVISYPEDPYEVDQMVNFDGYNSTGADRTYDSIESCDWTINQIGYPNVGPNEESPKSAPLVCDLHYTFEKVGTYKISLTVEDTWGYNDTDTILVTVEAGEIPDEYNPVAILNGSKKGYLDEEIVFDGSESYATGNKTIVNYLWTITDYDGEEVLLNNFSGSSELSYVFTELDSYNVELTVIDSEGLKDSANHLIILYEEDEEGENDFFGSEPEEGIKIYDFLIRGFDESLIEVGGDFEMEAIIENFADEDLDNVRMSFYLPEYGIEFTSSSTDLDKGQRKALSVNGFLPYDIEPGIYYPLIGISDDHIRRVKVGYLEVVEE